MRNSELLKSGRDILLSLHKALVDFERAAYEKANGAVSSGQFLSLLLDDDSGFAWLRKFSTLIVEIDELFAQKDGFAEEAVNSNLAKLRDLIEMKDEDNEFTAKYSDTLEKSPEAAGLQGELKNLLSDN